MKKIQIDLPKEIDNTVVYYEKIAERNEVNEENIKHIVQEKKEYDEKIFVEKNQDAVITNLEEGVYQILISGDENYEFAPFVVSIPAWNEDTHRMEETVEVIPKFTRKETPPQTGDDSVWGIYLVFAVISFIIVIFMSCHRYLKCGRMSHKNSKKRRT